MVRPRFSLAALLWAVMAIGGLIVFTKLAIDSLGMTSTPPIFLWRYWASFVCTGLGVSGVIWQLFKE
jgi:hypothetical protein